MKKNQTSKSFRTSASSIVFIFFFLAWIICFFVLTGGAKHASILGWLGSFYQWDSELYHAIWRQGYLNVSQKPLAFPPGYAYLVGTFNFIFGNFHLSAVILNLAGFVGTGVIFVKLISKQFQVSHILLSLIFLSSLTNYFVFSVYSDSVFIFLVWLLFYVLAARPRGKFADTIEVALFLTLPWIRLVAVSMVGLMFNKIKNAWLVVFSFAMFLVLQFFITGDFLNFLHVQQTHFAMPQGGIAEGIGYTFTRLLNFNDPWYLHMMVFPAFYFVTICTSSIWFWFKGHRNYALVMMGFLIMSHNMAFWRSTVRYDWFAMPLVFIPMIVGAKKSNYKWIYYLALFGLLAIQFYFQIKFARDFRQGLWAF